MSNPKHDDIDSATYSAEDNKIRLYANCRLDADLYLRVKEAGFKWAPKQELFVAPRWTPARVDLAIELAGTIEAEQTTMIERAEAKAERLDELADKNVARSNAYQDAAAAIGQRFANGQPILMGHHSQRSAERDKKAMNRAQEHAIKAHNAVNYWKYKATGVEHHANMKNSDRTRLNRIKTLLKELRGHQRTLNDARSNLKLWELVEAKKGSEKYEQHVEHYAGAFNLTPYQSGNSLWSQLREKEVTHDEVVSICITHFAQQIEWPTTYRWIEHTLNRLAYEKSFFECARYLRDITPVILQEFARNQGAEKPKGAKTDIGLSLTSPLLLPAHIATGNTVDLTPDQWRDMFEAVGYEVPIKTKRAPKKGDGISLFNVSVEDAEKLQAIWNQQANDKPRSYSGDTTNRSAEVLHIEQKTYSSHAGCSCDTVEIDVNGLRVWSSYKGKSTEPVAKIRICTSGGESVYTANRIIHLIDKPVTKKTLPVDWEGYTKMKASEATEAV